MEGEGLQEEGGLHEENMSFITMIQLLHSNLFVSVGGAVTRTMPRPNAFRFPVPPLSASPNHSALFLSLPATKVRRGNVRDVLQFKAHPRSGTGTTAYG